MLLERKWENRCSICEDFLAYHSTLSGLLFLMFCVCKLVTFCKSFRWSREPFSQYLFPNNKSWWEACWWPLVAPGKAGTESAVMAKALQRAWGMVGMWDSLCSRSWAAGHLQWWHFPLPERLLQGELNAEFFLGVSRRNSAQLSHRLGSGVPQTHCPVCQTARRYCMNSSIINPAD